MDETVRRRFAVILNEAAGALIGGHGHSDRLAAAFAANGLDPVFLGSDCGTLPERVRRAAAMDVAAVVAAGGDGTVACVAQILSGGAVPMAILPFGTMNLLAKDLALPIDDLEAAVAVVATGQVSAVDVAEVNGHVFLCASMLGLPARLARYRESRRGDSQFGLYARMARATLRAVARNAPLRVRVRIEGRTFRLRAASITVVANAIDESSGRTFGRPRLDAGELAVYVVRQLTFGGLMRLVTAMLFGGWRQNPNLEERRTGSLDILSGRSTMQVMNDGEVMLLEPPLRYRIRPGAIKVIVPTAAAPGA